MDNAYIAHVLRQVGALKQIKGENRFKVRAFENAARALETLTQPVSIHIEAQTLTDIDGIGQSIAEDIIEIYQTGTCSIKTRLLSQFDEGLLDLIEIQGLGPKRIKTIYDELGVANLEALKAAAQDGSLASLSGFGKKTQANILKEIERLEQTAGRMPLPTALTLANHVLSTIESIDGVERAQIAGSIRRGKETIGDIDILVVAQNPPLVMDAVTQMRGVMDVIAHGDKKTSILLAQGMQVDVRIVEAHQFGSALHYFTGSKEHHVKLRARAKRQGLKINEYGVFSVEDDTTPLASQTEEDLFTTLGLSFIPPELREGTQEIEQAEQTALPHLITLDDIRGDIHMHTTASDGEASILEMAEAAKALGYQFIVITDHSQVLSIANGLTPKRFAAHIEAIEAANTQIEDFTIFSGLEVDILKDGTLDMDHDLLARCDWVVGSIHTAMTLDSQAMTDRLLRAIDTNLLSCLGHPTGRILGGRQGYQYDMETVLDACAQHHTAVEINGSPGRFDLNPENAARAKQKGVQIVLGSDAHSTRGLESMHFAVKQARRAWLEPADVLNTLQPQDFITRTRLGLKTN